LIINFSNNIFEKWFLILLIINITFSSELCLFSNLTIDKEWYGNSDKFICSDESKPCVYTETINYVSYVSKDFWYAKT